MAQRYKVYFTGRPVYFVTEVSDCPDDNNIAMIRSCGKLDIVLVESALAGGAKAVYLVCPDADHSWNLFTDQFRRVDAAGGLVRNELGEMLFIYRLDRWDLPKGKVEEDEEIEAAAIREVEEECGVVVSPDINFITDSWHTYRENDEYLLKKTSWFLMKANGKQNIVPQTSEGITQARFIAEHEFKKILIETYPSVSEVVQLACKH
jgi:8-oxo-dGTP pyrophosphatase MutT (NUDIX family)